MRSSKRKPRWESINGTRRRIKTGIEADIEYKAEVEQTIIERMSNPTWARRLMGRVRKRLHSQRQEIIEKIFKG
jgi:hypothetical protein